MTIIQIRELRVQIPMSTELFVKKKLKKEKKNYSYYKSSMLPNHFHFLIKPIHCNVINNNTNYEMY